MFEGGAGFTYEQVSRMTPDQIYHRLCNRDVLKRKGGRRLAKTKSLSMASDRVKGRAEDGSPIEGRIAGKSRARQLMEQEQKKKRKKRGRRRERRGN